MNFIVMCVFVNQKLLWEKDSSAHRSQWQWL